MPEVPSKICVRAKDYLDDGSFSGDLENLAFSYGAVCETDIDYFRKLGELHIIEDDQGAIDFDNGSVVDPGCNIIVSGGCVRVDVECVY